MLVCYLSYVQCIVSVSQVRKTIKHGIREVSPMHLVSALPYIQRGEILPLLGNTDDGVAAGSL
jgi:hypothetical protein